MKNRLRLKGKLKFKKLLNGFRAGWCYKNTNLTLQQYLRGNRYLFNRSIG